MSPELHFLVVDDQPTVRCIVIGLLHKIGHTKISEAGDGMQALKLIQSNSATKMPIDFVVTDWNMPGMNGMALLQTIRKNADMQRLPVLMITSEGEAHNIVAAMRAGADGYIVKASLNIGSFKEAVQKIMMERGFVTSACR
jgi:two-component system chemotaxis response regulator CheY